MNPYFQNLIPRLKQFGQTLKKIEQLVDRVWVVADSERQLVSYRFLRDNKLLITNNGDVEEGEWSYLPPESLYLKFGNERKMFSQGFLLEDVLVLQKQQNDSTPFLMYDSKIGSLADLQTYMQDQYAFHNNLNKMGDFYIQQEKTNFVLPGDAFYDNEFNLVTDAEVVTKTRVFRLDKGRINKILHLNKFMTDIGDIELLGSEPGTIKKGDTIISTDLINFRKFRIKKDYKYSNVTIENNAVIDRTIKWMREAVVLLIVIIGMTCFILLN